MAAATVGSGIVILSADGDDIVRLAENTRVVGSAQDFVELWRESLAWTQQTYGQDGFERARLLRDEEDAAAHESLGGTA